MSDDCLFFSQPAYSAERFIINIQSINPHTRKFSIFRTMPFFLNICRKSAVHHLARTLTIREQIVTEFSHILSWTTFIIRSILSRFIWMSWRKHPFRLEWGYLYAVLYNPNISIRPRASPVLPHHFTFRKFTKPFKRAYSIVWAIKKPSLNGAMLPHILHQTAPVFVIISYTIIIRIWA